MTPRVCRHCAGTGRELDRRKVGRAVRRARKAMDWTLRELARRAECSAAFACDMEYGRRGVTGPAAQRIFALLGIKP